MHNSTAQRVNETEQTSAQSAPHQPYVPPVFYDKVPNYGFPFGRAAAHDALADLERPPRNIGRQLDRFQEGMTCTRRVFRSRLYGGTHEFFCVEMFRQASVNARKRRDDTRKRPLGPKESKKLLDLMVDIGVLVLHPTGRFYKESELKSRHLVHLREEPYQRRLDRRQRERDETRRCQMEAEVPLTECESQPILEGTCEKSYLETPSEMPQDASLPGSAHNDTTGALPPSRQALTSALVPRRLAPMEARRATAAEPMQAIGAAMGDVLAKFAPALEAPAAPIPKPATLARDKTSASRPASEAPAAPYRRRPQSATGSLKTESRQERPMQSHTFSASDAGLQQMQPGLYRNEHGRLFNEAQAKSATDFLSMIPKLSTECREDVEARLAEAEEARLRSERERMARDAQEADRDRAAKRAAFERRQLAQAEALEAEGVRPVTVYLDLGPELTADWIKRELCSWHAPDLNVPWAVQQRVRVAAMTHALESLQKATQNGKAISNPAGYLFAVAREFQDKRPTRVVPEHEARKRPDLIVPPGKLKGRTPRESSADQEPYRGVPFATSEPAREALRPVAMPPPRRSPR